MVTVLFYGDLKPFGQKFKLDVKTAGEALRALLFQIPKLRQHMNNDYYRLRIAGKDVSENTLEKSMSSVLPENAVIHIIPKAAGAKNAGIFSVIAGAAMVVIGIITIKVGGAALIVSGLGMMAGGVAMMLTKTPEIKTDGSQNISNTSFSNLDNAVTQGEPIPLCYGEMMIGSKVLSQGLRTE